MNDFENRQAHQEVQQLHRLAMDASDEGQYATMERLLEHAVSIAQRLDDLPLLIKERYWFAAAQRMQGKYVQAIATSSWLIGLASDPASSHLLSDPDTLWYFASAFMDFVSSGRSLPEMPMGQLLWVVADGLDWLERVGKADWAAGLRYMKGRLLRAQGDDEGARIELESALALKRRHPEAPGYTLATHLLELAELLSEPPFKAYAEAIALAEEVLASPESGTYARSWAYKTLAYIRLEMREYEAALDIAQQSLQLAQAMESPGSITETYELLGRIHRARGHDVEAAQAAVQEWYWARRHGTVEYCYDALINCARVRYLQARVACGLDMTEETLPEQRLTQEQVQVAQRRLRSVSRFVAWATPLAARLDRARGNAEYQEELERELQQARELEAWLIEV